MTKCKGNCHCHDEATAQQGEQPAPQEPQPPKDDRSELIETLQRLQAEFENFKKRSEREMAEYRVLANQQLIAQFLPVVDNFELALSHAKGGDPALVKGMELVYSQLMDVLESNHVKIIDPEGVFDPHRCEALLSEQREGAAKNTILEVLQKGYELSGRVLRTAKVKIAK